MWSVVERDETVQEKLQGRVASALRSILPDERIEAWCQAHRRGWRKRLLTPVVVLWSCVWKHLDGVRSARALESYWNLLGERLPREKLDGSAFCQARKRLPARVLLRALAYVGAWASERGGACWRGLRVTFVDGSTSALPNRPVLARTFGRARNQHGRARLPALRWVGLFCAGCGASWDVAFGPYGVGEARLFVQLALRLAADVLVIGDGLFCSYLHAALLRQRGSHLLVRRHVSRKDACVSLLGPHDELHRWKRPRVSHTAPAHVWRRLPEHLDVRVIRWEVRRKGYRSYRLVLCTTLLDVRDFPTAELVAWYLRRWNVETDLRSLKGWHGLDLLTAQTPGTVVREFYSGFLAFNGVRAVGAASGAKVRRLSHAGLLDDLRNTSLQMAAVPVQHLPGLYAKLLGRVRGMIQEQRPRPPEPRALIRDPRRGYRILRSSRADWKKAHSVA